MGNPLQGLAQLVVHVDEQERVSTEIEDVLLRSNLFHPECALPDIRDCAFHSRLRRDVVLRSGAQPRSSGRASAIGGDSACRRSAKALRPRTACAGATTQVAAPPLNRCRADSRTVVDQRQSKRRSRLRE